MEQLQGAHLHPECPRLARAISDPIDKAEPGAECAELRRERESRGPRADDQHVEIDRALSHPLRETRCIGGQVPFIHGFAPASPASKKDSRGLHDGFMDQPQYVAMHAMRAWREVDDIMYWDANWHSGWFFGMHLAWWIFWIVVTVAIWTVLTRSAASPAQKGESALEVLRRRYAEGALTTEEYEERRAKLAETAG